MVNVLSLIAEVREFCSAAVASVEMSAYPAYFLLNVLELAAPLSLLTVPFHPVLLDVVF